MNPMGKFLGQTPLERSLERMSRPVVLPLAILSEFAYSPPPLRKNKDILCYNTRLSIMTNILYLQMFTDEEWLPQLVFGPFVFTVVTQEDTVPLGGSEEKDSTIIIIIIIIILIPGDGVSFIYFVRCEARGVFLQGLLSVAERLQHQLLLLVAGEARDHGPVPRGARQPPQELCIIAVNHAGLNHIHLFWCTHVTTRPSIHL